MILARENAFCQEKAGGAREQLEQHVPHESRR